MNKNKAAKTPADGEPVKYKNDEIVYVKQPEQKPVAWMYTSHYKGNEWFITRYQSELTTYKADKVQPLYTAPPKREWVDLMQEDMPGDANPMYDTDEFLCGVAWARIKLKEKND